MAKAYLGKISALVTANTSDFNSKLNASAKEVRSFAASMQSTLSRAQASATASLRGIYTESQKVSRALQAVATQRLSFKGFDGAAVGSIREAVDQFRALQAASVAVNEPLSNAARTVERLSASVQQSFDPALKSAQKSAEYLDAALKRGGIVGEQSFERIRQKALAAAEAANRLAEASQLASVGPRGRELAFAAPRVRDALAASADVRQRAANAPAAALEGGRVSSDVQKLVALDNLIQKRRAEIESGTILNIDTTQARASLQNLLAVAERVRSSIDSQIQVAVDTQAARANVERLRAALSTIRENVTFTVTGEVQNFSQARQELGLLTGAVGQFDRAQREAFGRDLARLGELVETGDVAELEQVRQIIARIRQDVDDQLRINLDTRNASEAALQLDRTLQRLRENAEFAITARPQNLGQVQSELQGILSQFDQLTEAQRGSLGGRVTAVIEAVGRQDLDAAIEALQQLRQDAGAAITVRVDTDAAEGRIRRINEAWDYAVRGVPSSIAQVDSEFQALAARIGRLNIADRLDLDPLIRDFRDSVAAGDPLIAQFERLLTLQGRLDGIESAATPAAGGLGADIGDPSRQIEQLRAGIVGVKGQLDSLPASIRAGFIPAITAAQVEFARLVAIGPAATAEEIENARNEVDRLSSSASRASSVISSLGGAGLGGVIDGLDGRVVQGFTSQLQVLQGVIAGVAGAARNDLAAAFEGVRQSIVSAMGDGTIATRATQEAIDASIQSLARMAATASNQNVGRVLTQVARAGDVGRRGLDRFALAAQQAGFAIDDFFSATGGIDQRIRAVSNNITQLAFIIGSTKGLFIGLSVVIGSQVVLAISKWINSGRTLEDNSKALNDTLARQKSLVEALAESFRALGDSLTQGTLSGQASDARDFAESLNRARKARKDLNDEGVLQNDPAVRRERANQARIERELQNAGDQGRVVQLQAQLEDSRRREQVRRGILAQPAPDANEVEDVLRRRAPNPFRRAVPNLPEGGGLAALRERRAALEGPLERLREIISEGPSFFDGGFRFNAASQSFDEINSLAARLDSAISNAVDGIADDLANSARGPAATIRNAQQEVAAAIEAGVPGARRLGVLVDQVGNEFQDAIKALEAAVAITDPAERERAIADARARLDSVRGRRSDIEARADSVRRERTLNPERNIDAVLSRTQSEVDRIGAPANALRSQLRELQFQRDTVSAQLEATPADPVLIRAEQELTRALISLEGAVSDLSFDAAEAARLRGDPERGRTLSMTPAERAAEDIQKGLNDIQARFQAVAENVTGIIDTAGMEEAQARFIEDQKRQLAPAVFALQDAVQNAVLQGPSRAALNASDVTTTEGSRELNRLLRGDDPARDVNLLELQKQSQLLQAALEEQKKIAERLGGVVV